MSSSDEFASADEDVQGAEKDQKKARSQTKSKEQQPQAEKTGGVRKLEKPPGTTRPKPSKLGQKTDPAKPVEAPDQPSSPKRPPNVEACWEFESWEDWNKQEKEKEAKQKTAIVTDGWGSEDDDDWEQPTNSDVNESPKPLPGRDKKQIIPVPASKNNEPQDLSKVLDKLALGGGGGEQQKAEAAGGGWGWNSWGGGISSFLSTATESVANLTSHVSHGLSTVIESGMGVPDPAEMARQDLGEEKKKRESEPETDKKDQSPTDASKSGPSGLGSFVTGVTQMSSKVITGGLDTLEGIGKKTMNILQENDPGLMNKRKLLGLEGDKPVLSHMLREAKVKSEEKERNMKQLQKNLYKKQLHFETLFDDYCGLVHLEALEMLSKQSTLKLDSLMTPLSGKALKELQETMTEVRELCELPESDGDESDGTHTAEELQDRLTTAFEDMETKVELQDLVEVWQKDIRFLETDNPRSAQELYDRALRSLAQTTAIAVNKMHKLAELLLIQEHHSTVNEADSLVQLTTVLCWHLGGIAARFGSILSDDKLFVITDDEDVNGLITSIFMEGTNSVQYIQNAFQLFLPVLQLGAA